MTRRGETLAEAALKYRHQLEKLLLKQKAGDDTTLRLLRCMDNFECAVGDLLGWMHEGGKKEELNAFIFASRSDHLVLLSKWIKLVTPPPPDARAHLWHLMSKAVEKQDGKVAQLMLQAIVQDKGAEKMLLRDLKKVKGRAAVITLVSDDDVMSCGASFVLSMEGGTHG